MCVVRCTIHVTYDVDWSRMPFRHHLLGNKFRHLTFSFPINWNLGWLWMNKNKIGEINKFLNMYDEISPVWDLLATHLKSITYLYFCLTLHPVFFYSVVGFFFHCCCKYKVSTIINFCCWSVRDLDKTVDDDDTIHILCVCIFKFLETGNECSNGHNRA